VLSEILLPTFAQRLRHCRPKPSGHWHLDEMVARIAGETVYLWRAVDHEGEVLDLVVQRGRDKAAALKLMRKLLKKQGFTPTVIVTDKLRSYAAAFAELGLVAHHERGLRQNNRKCRTSRSADASERCSGSSRQDQLSASSPCMPPSTTRSLFNAI